jgi:hypothetical protein
MNNINRSVGTLDHLNANHKMQTAIRRPTQRQLTKCHHTQTSIMRYILRPLDTRQMVHFTLMLPEPVSRCQHTGQLVVVHWSILLRHCRKKSLPHTALDWCSANYDYTFFVLQTLNFFFPFHSRLPFWRDTQYL